MNADNMNDDNLNDGNNESPAQQDQVLPILKFHDQTPVSAPGSKRQCAVLSPCGELDDSDILNSTIAKKIKDAISKSMQKLMPNVLNKFKSQIESIIMSTIAEATTKLKAEVLNMVKGEIVNVECRSNLKALSEAELLESYNRRENVKILGITEETSNGRKETIDATIKNVLTVSNSINANITEQDISTAHRLPSRGAGVKPVIVKFTRRVKKTHLLQRKKELASTDLYNNVKIFEDLTKARMNFLRMMKSDTRIQSAWTREGSIYFLWKDDQNVHKIHGLYEGGDTLKYSLNSVMSCFTGVFPFASAQSGS